MRIFWKLNGFVEEIEKLLYLYVVKGGSVAALCPLYYKS
jgi:hypothetical protein